MNSEFSLFAHGSGARTCWGAVKQRVFKAILPPVRTAVAGEGGHLSVSVPEKEGKLATYFPANKLGKKR